MDFYEYCDLLFEIAKKNQTIAISIVVVLLVAIIVITTSKAKKPKMPDPTQRIPEPIQYVPKKPENIIVERKLEQEETKIHAPQAPVVNEEAWNRPVEEVGIPTVSKELKFDDSTKEKLLYAAAAVGVFSILRLFKRK